MFIYNVLLDNNAASVLDVSSEGVELHLIKMADACLDGGLSFDENFMTDKHGFLLSAFEQDQFATHHRIWQKFKQSSYEYCLIIQSTVEFRLPLRETLLEQS